MRASLIVCIVVELSLAVAARAHDGPTIATELQRHALDVAKTLEHPCPFEDRSDPCCIAFWHAVDQATAWPLEIFREPLLRLLRKGESSLIQYRAAAALLYYADPFILDELEIYRESKRPLVFGCNGTDLGTKIARMLELRITDGVFDVYPDGLLQIEWPDLSPVNLDQVGGLHPGMTVPLAVTVLDDPELSIRVQAFRWLFLQGMVLEVEPFEDGWEVATSKERLALLRYRGDDLDLGRDRFRKMLEGIATAASANSEPHAVMARLANVLAGVGSPIVRRLAFPTIHRELGTPLEAAELDSGRPERVDILVQALQAVIEVADRQDLADGLEWIRSPNVVVREAGYCVLGQIDDPLANDEVLARIADPEPFSDTPYWGWPNVPSALQRTQWTNRERAWNFARAINARTQRLATELERDQASYSKYCELNSLLYDLSVINGHPIKFPDPGRVGFYIPWAVDRAKQWDAWINDNDPGTPGLAD